MKNIKRSPDYINISHKIKECKSLDQLRQVLPGTIRFISEAIDSESNDIIDLFYDKEKELGVSIDHFPFPVAIFGSNVSKLNTL